ncbi:hypothetical protein PCANC_25627 [Puccinia coronata f. sp. avenae]|uniref:Uncharacterized protein n=1 Tax=Puccinia coronata f. sp. avenae TaxID=200324 RepID=A0A2N5RXP5_9BASI|nr:hypothetical protein PCANC_26297 [Puccinia coronata f. sp. avenae]PLW25534.1 hypothetical protein PCANC_25627 [Puccinia coronata f. sp. avenae]
MPSLDDRLPSVLHGDQQRFDEPTVGVLIARLVSFARTCKTLTSEPSALSNYDAFLSSVKPHSSINRRVAGQGPRLATVVPGVSAHAPRGTSSFAGSKQVQSSLDLAPTCRPTRAGV